MQTKNLRSLLAAIMLFGVVAPTQAAGTWPERTVKLVVPFPAGGNVDTYTRIFAPALAAALGQTVIIENRPGATGAIGVDQVARSAPDGYTVLVGNITSVVGTSVLGVGPATDPLTRLSPVCTTIDGEVVALANAQSGIRSLDGLQSVAQSGSVLSFGSSGLGSISHLAMVQLLDRLQVPATHVPYKGNGQFLVDLLANHIQLGMVDLTNSRPYIDAGRLVPLAVGGNTRFPELPNVPATGELGITRPNFSAWIGLLLPRGTPEPIGATLGHACRLAMQHPDVQAYSTQNGNKPAFRTAAEMRTLIAEGFADWDAFVKSDLIATSLKK